jgi:nicotinamidase-related amidase
MAHDPFYDLVPRPAEPRWRSGAIALLTIDLQYLDAHPAGWMGRLARLHTGIDPLRHRWQAIDAILPNVRRLQDAFRAAGEEVMHARVRYRTRNGRDAGKAFMPDPAAEPVPRDRRDEDFLEAIAPLDDEIIFDKTSSSVFNSTAIDSVLRRMRIEHLVITGIVTDGCVELSARDAADRGYSVTLIADGCAASTPEAHVDALARLTDGGFIVAHTTEAALRMLDALAVEAVAGTAESRPARRRSTMLQDEVPAKGGDARCTT